MNQNELELDIKKDRDNPIEDPYRKLEYKALRSYADSRFSSQFRECKVGKFRVNKRKLRNRERRLK